MSSRVKKIKGIYLRGNVFWLTHGTGKNRVQLSLDTSDQAEAIEKAREIIENPELNPSNGFMKELERYSDKNVEAGTWTANSRVSKFAVLKMFGEDVDFKDLPDITEKDIEEWHTRQKKRVPKTAHSYMIIVRAFLNWAVEENLIRKSPAAEIDLGKVNRTARVKFCKFEDRDSLIKAAEANDDLLFILYCGFYAGMRKDEIIEARPEWFDLDQNLIHVEKTQTFNIKNKKYRAVPLHPDFKKFLERYGKKVPFMLQPDVVKGRGRYRYDFRKPFSQFMDRNNLSWVTPHVMRHTFASLLAIQGVSLYKIARWLGDTLATTEKHYAHLVPQDDAISLLTTPTRHTGTQLTPKEIAELQKKVEEYETALKKLVRADRLAEYWVSLKTQTASSN